MKPRKIVIGALLVAVGLPAALILVGAVAIYFLDDSSGVIASSGEERAYLLHVPESYDPSTPAALVISLHGAAGWPAQQRDTSRWNRVADEHGFIVVYPAGTGFPKAWRAFADADVAADVRFISELIEMLGAAYNIDPARIYANGLSNGGGMTFALSCMLADRIAAVGMVAATQTLPWSWCPEPLPVPVIAFHGTADPMAPYDGGLSGGFLFRQIIPGVEDWIASWARRNGCGPFSFESTLTGGITRLEYQDCEDDADVVLYTVEGGGHTWPGGKPPPAWLTGPTSNSIDASARMWAFFHEHPHRRY